MRQTTANKRAGLLTLREALELHLASKKRRQTSTTPRVYRTRLERELPEWMDLAIEDITESMILDKYDELTHLQGPSGSAVLRILHAVCNYVERVDYEYFSPMTVLTIDQLWHGNLKHRPNTFEGEDIGYIWIAIQTLGRLACDYLSFCLLTGIDSEDASNLSWQQIDLENAVVMLDPPVALSNLSVSILAARSVVVPERVFTQYTKSGWSKIRSTTGIKQIVSITGLRISVDDLTRTSRLLTERIAANNMVKDPHRIAEEVTTSILKQAAVVAKKGRQPAQIDASQQHCQ